MSKWDKLLAKILTLSNDVRFKVKQVVEADDDENT